jgi:5'-3' exonuclease
LINVDSYDISFELSKPFRPVEQLLAVLPADSVKALPESCQQLMLSPDSPIIDIYSRDIPIDPNGKILPWLWVVLLPFIDETRIVAALKLCEDEMTEEEKQRNTFGTPLMFLHSGHALGVTTLSHLDYSVQQQVGEEEFVPANYSFPPTKEIGDGICGLLSLRNDLVEEFGLQKLIRAPNRPLRAFEDIPANRVMSLEYKFPEETDHLSALLPGVDLGMKVLCDYDGIVARPKLNKGKFNIADIAERMREEKSMRGSQYPHQRMVLAGLGGRSSQPYPQHQDYQRQGQGQGQYPAYNNQRSEGGGNYDYRDSYRAPRQDNYHHSHTPSSEARNFSFRSNYDEYSRAPERDRGGYTARSDRDYPSRTDPSYQSQYPPHQYPQYPPRQHPPQDSYHRSYPPSQDSGSYRGYAPPPPSASFNPPPYYPPQHQPQYRDAPPPNWNPPPRGRAPPMPPLAGQMGYPSDSRMAGYSNGAPPQQSLGDLRNQFSQSAHQGYGYAPAPPAAPSTRDPRMRR